jgi:hypothetical protein
MRLSANAHAACDRDYDDFLVRPVVLGERKLSHHVWSLVGRTALETRWTGALFARF